MITLYRGDDTTFKGVKRLRVTIESKESLAGCSATFEVCGVVKHVPDVSTGSFYLSLTGEDTAKMPLGTHTATLRVYDDESRRRTVANTIMVCVTERIGDAYPGEEDIAVSLGAIVAWRNVSDKPSVNPSMCRMNVALTPLHTLSSLFPHRLRRPQGTPKARLDLATECVTPILRQLFRVVVKSSLKQFNCHVK